MEQVFNRVAKWNALRYVQEYNHELAVKLLREEQREWMEADNLVDRVHELCDVVFVAFGVMWKLEQEIAPEAANRCFEIVDEASVVFGDPATLCSATIDCLERSDNVDLQLSYALATALFAQAQMLDYGLTFDQIIECMLVLCDSNDSKTVKLTESHVKANSGDKGSYYKSPVPGIAAIVELI